MFGEGSLGPGFDHLPVDPIPDFTGLNKSSYCKEDRVTRFDHTASYVDRKYVSYVTFGLDGKIECVRNKNS